MTSNNTIDRTKPIEYVDGSPAVYLGRLPDADRHSVTPRGRPNARTGNFYNDEGQHIWANHMSIRNVNLVDRAIETPKAEGYTVDETTGVISPPDPMKEKREFVGDLLVHMGYPINAKQVRSGFSDYVIDRTIKFLNENKHRIPDTFE